MSDIQLFRLSSGTATELLGTSCKAGKATARPRRIEHANVPQHLELTLRTPADLERAKPLLERSYSEG